MFISHTLIQTNPEVKQHACQKNVSSVMKKKKTINIKKKQKRNHHNIPNILVTSVLIQFRIFLDQDASNDQARSMVLVLRKAEQRGSNAVGWRTQKKTEKKRTLWTEKPKIYTDRPQKSFLTSWAVNNRQKQNALVIIKKWCKKKHRIPTKNGVQSLKHAWKPL